MKPRRKDLPDTPFKDRGERLRRRRKELQRDGALPDAMIEVAKRMGVSRSALSQWEQGKTWITQKNRAGVLKALDWTEQELDYGVSLGGGAPDMSFHPVSPEEIELLALFRALGAEQLDFIHKLRTKVAAKQTMRQYLGRDDVASDADVRKRMPVTGSRRST